MSMKILDEAEIAHTYIGKVRQFMRDFGLGDRSPAELESALESAGLLLIQRSMTLPNGEHK
jgi:hypothetical protein